MKGKLSGHLENEKGACSRCDHLVLHDTYEYLGLCARSGNLITVSGEACEDFEKLRSERIRQVIQERGWVHCVSCRRPIYSLEELEEHSSELIRPEVYVDEVAWEEAPCAD